MWLYEGILKILDEKGPLPLSALCYEADSLFLGDEFTHGPSEIYTVLNKEKELFSIKDGMISINPGKQPLKLSVFAELPGVGAHQLRVDFTRGQFILIEWRDKDSPRFNGVSEPKQPGDIAAFKRKVYKSAIWNWDKSYLSGEGIILDGFTWSVKLKTKSAVYERSGTNKFPVKWKILQGGIRELTGYPFG
ncbi:hypothetical protein DRW41_13210 [Neobacillus piezotolerans]|uniref:Uncharacterized protein n=2 Tax=Neobacillus piezotolerans TaxID=2259171 RepID=A0A3D8GPR6_9BACI|nr:hypothetical protein DRW41_13210 [Neobacillus piezotolerans]